ncbi:hypothetical protein WJU16_22670 [Chitinophaga pollutisoli]|uniref:DUF2231 domain-containing protein n=1 Tax=Chitinophaga pollutisoli TaxID=3133966 RepID=A0ABZ2YMW4_9BACT
MSKTMNPTHIHLIITHLPIYGALIGLSILLYGMVTGSHHTKIAAFAVLFFASVGGIIAFSTGEGAEETVGHIQGISKNVIEEHEEFAEIALINLIVLGVAALAAGILTITSSRFNRALSVIVLALSVSCFGLTAWTGYLGEKYGIRKSMLRRPRCQIRLQQTTTSNNQ